MDNSYYVFAFLWPVPIYAILQMSSVKNFINTISEHKVRIKLRTKTRGLHK